LSTEKTLIFTPTYNERENIMPMFLAIKGLGLKADILFLDDNSPDGTGEVMEQIKSQNPGVFVIHRTGKLGIGSAHKEGIRWAYEKGYDRLLTMDADFTHSPEYIPAILNLLKDNDVSIGSRYLMKDSLKNWNLLRKTLTWTAHVLTTHLLKLRYDSTGAFRGYNLKTLPHAVFLKVESNSYSFFFESLHLLNFNGFKIVEFPVSLPTRAAGSSKMTVVDALKSVYFLLNMCFKTYFQNSKIRVRSKEV